jgi:hypothetical protein
MKKSIKGSLSVLLLAFLSVTGGEALRTTSCDASARDNDSYSSYFQGLKSVYGLEDTLYKCYTECGWPNSASISSELPTLIVAVGLEASGQKMWMSSVFNSLVQSDPSICSSDVSQIEFVGFVETMRRIMKQ